MDEGASSLAGAIEQNSSLEMLSLARASALYAALLSTLKHCFDRLGNELGLSGVASFALLLLRAETRRDKQIHKRVKVSLRVRGALKELLVEHVCVST